MLFKSIHKFVSSLNRRFKQLEKRNPLLNTLLLLFAVVFFWRGIWGLLDRYFFPNDEILSYGFSAVIGLFILLLDDFESV